MAAAAPGSADLMSIYAILLLLAPKALLSVSRPSLTCTLTVRSNQRVFPPGVRDKISVPAIDHTTIGGPGGGVGIAD